MFIDAHSHGMHAERNLAGRLAPPLMPVWKSNRTTKEEYLKNSVKSGIERIVLLDPPDITFFLVEIFGNYVIPVPQVDIDTAAPDDIDQLFQKGARGIKFISPSKSYGSDSYFPVYDVIRARKGLAVFHTGFLILDLFEPGGLFGRKSYTDIADMRPSALDRVARAFPDLKILMAHFGNPWWEEAWKMISSHKNIFADLSGGTAYRRSMSMWREIFAPNGNLDANAVGKLCFGSDGGFFEDDGGNSSLKEIIDFYLRLAGQLNLPAELCQKIYRENILNLTDLKTGV